MRSSAELEESIAATEIQANEIVGLDREGGSDGTMEGQMRTSADKLRALRHLEAYNGPEAPFPRSDEASRVVYIGDSPTDLECLLEADIGIVMRDEKMGSGQRELAKTLERLGIDVVSLRKLDASDGRRRDGGQKTIFWARDFEDVVRVLGIGT